MKRLMLAGIIVILVIGAFFFWLRRAREHGFSARHEPTRIEKVVARTMRNLAITSDLRDAKNPLEQTPEVLESAREHFADHCASCHGNDGRGQTSIGQNFFPKVPDMTLDDTQSLTDGQIFAIIKNGVRLTGMPAWGEDTPEGDAGSWELVHFIRHLPEITEDELVEMEMMNPVSRGELERLMEEEAFLSGAGFEDATTESARGEGKHH